jgi:molybdopterin adenylyltransferase
VRWYSRAFTRANEGKPRYGSNDPNDRNDPNASYNRRVSVQEHKAYAPVSVSCFVLTVSDTRTEANDSGGQAIRELLDSGGHSVTGHTIVRDDPAAVVRAVNVCLVDAGTQVIITTGGTGITSRDGTFEAIDGLLEKRLTGFGELFRMLSYEQIGSGAMLSRAEGGVANGKLLFAMPGSTKAVELAMTKLILPELRHLLHELRKQ